MKTIIMKLFAGAVIGWLALVSPVSAQEGDAKPSTVSVVEKNRTVGLAAAAALAVAISILGASYAVGRIGAAACGALLEKPELFGRCILFLALAEGLAVLGFAIAMMLIQKI
jgi:V/A-type H+-transporting ATPase subunit K